MRHEAGGRVTRAGALCIVLVLTVGAIGYAQPPGGLQMPDPKQMSGVPLPTTDITAGTVTVRVIRGSLSNIVPDQLVELTGEVAASRRTNAAGRAEFAGLKPGARLKAVTVV